MIALIAIATLGQTSEASYLGRPMPAMEFHRLDLRETIKRLFHAAGAPYSLGDGVEGIVEMKLRPANFGKDLLGLLRAAGCTYGFEHGVFAIFRDPKSNRHLPLHTFKNGSTIKGIETLLDTIDANFWISSDIKGSTSFQFGNQSFEAEFQDLMDLTGTEYRFENNVFIVFPKGKLPPSVVLAEPVGLERGILLADYRGPEVREIIKVLMRDVNAKVSLDAKVKGTVHLKLHNFLVANILDFVLLDKHADWKFEDGTFVIRPKQ